MFRGHETGAARHELRSTTRGHHTKRNLDEANLPSCQSEAYNEHGRTRHSAPAHESVESIVPTVPAEESRSSGTNVSDLRGATPAPLLFRLCLTLRPLEPDITRAVGIPPIGDDAGRTVRVVLDELFTVAAVMPSLRDA